MAAVTSHQPLHNGPVTVSNNEFINLSAEQARRSRWARLSAAGELERPALNGNGGRAEREGPKSDLKAFGF